MSSNGSTITLREQSTGVHPLTSISSLSSDTYFLITVDSGLLLYGKTSQTGNLDLNTIQLALNTPHHSATLTLYVDAMTSAEVRPTNVTSEPCCLT